MGFLMQTTMLIAQNSVEQKDLGVASSASTFFRSDRRLVRRLAVRRGLQPPASPPSRRPPGSAPPAPARHRRRPVRPAAHEAAAGRDLRLGFLESLASSISGVFGWAILFAVLVPLIAAFVKEIPLRGGFDKAEESARPGPQMKPRPAPGKAGARHQVALR